MSAMYCNNDSTTVKRGEGVGAEQSVRQQKPEREKGGQGSGVLKVHIIVDG